MDAVGRKRKCLYLAIGIAICFSSSGDVPTNIRIAAKQTPSGKIDTRYLDGDDGSTAIPLLWPTAINNISILSGTPYAVSLCALYLTQPGSPNATVSVADGYALPSGWSIGNPTSTNCTLDYSGTGTTIGTAVKLKAVRSGFTAITPFEFTITVTPPAGDTIAPPKVTGVAASTGDVLSSTVTWDDLYDDGSGLDYYEVLVDGVVTATVQADESVNRRLTLAVVNIGNASGGSCTKSSNQYTITASGNTGGGLDSTADGAVGCLVQISGPVCVTGLVNSLTLPATYSKGGAELRSTIDSNSVAYSDYGLRVSGGYNIEYRRRLTTGGTRGNIGTSGGTGSITLPHWVQACRDANNVVTGRHSSDGNTWTTTGSETSSLASSLYAGLSATATSASAIVSAVIQEVNITSGNRISTTLNGLSGGAHTITVRGVDDLVNTGTASAGVAITVSAPADTTAPSAPANPSAANGGQTSLNFTADACTDSSGIVSYTWAISTTSNGTYTDQTSSASPSFQLIGLSASTTRYGKVKCTDNAGNVSAYSSVVNATTSAVTLSTGPEITDIETVSVSGSNATVRITHTTPAGAANYHVYLCQVSSSATTTCTSWYYMSTYVHTSASVDMTIQANQGHIIYITAANADSSIALTCTRSTNARCTANGYFFSSVATTGLMKWHPGYYMQVRGTAETSQSTRWELYDGVTNNSAVNGVTWGARWGNLETSQGVYDFSSLTNDINKLQSLTVPKYLLLRMDTFGGYGRTIAGAVSNKIFPSYINTQGCVFEGLSGSATVPTFKWWRSDCMDRYIALIEAMGEELDDEDYFEGVVLLRETSVQVGGVPTSVSEFSASAYDTQLRRLYVAAKAAFPTTNVFSPLNWLSGFSETGSIPHHNYAHSIGIGYFNPDTCSDCAMWGDKITRGATSGSTDARGVIPIAMSAEASELGLDVVGPDGGYTPIQLNNFAEGTMHANYMIWENQSYTGTSEQKWSTGLLPFINANAPVTYTSCPTVYTNGCN